MDQFSIKIYKLGQFVSNKDKKLVTVTQTMVDYIENRQIDQVYYQNCRFLIKSTTFD